MESDQQKIDEQIRRLAAEREALEAQAGITATVAEAYEPISGLGRDMEESPDEYFADTHDQTRDMVRDAYFGVQDIALRKNLISLKRRSERLSMESYEAEVIDAAKALGAAEERAAKRPWFVAVMIVIGCVIVGGWKYGDVGALGGLLAGIGFAWWHMSEVARDCAADVVQQKRDLAMEKDSTAEISRLPDTFSQREEATGERDPKFDLESARANLYATQRNM